MRCCGSLINSKNEFLPFRFLNHFSFFTLFTPDASSRSITITITIIIRSSVAILARSISSTMGSSSDEFEWEKDPDPFGFNAEWEELEAARVARQAGGAQAGGT